VGEPLPDDLVAWWRRSCGTTSFFAGRLPTGFAPYSIDEAVECRTGMLDIAACDDAELAELSGSEMAQRRHHACRDRRRSRTRH
jgi:hypothetical protein